MSTPIGELLDIFCAHLAAFDLPDLCSVTVASSMLTPNISAQLSDHDSPQLAAALLRWADTLTDPTAEAWRVPDGDSVHLAVTGLLPGGARVRVYGGVPFHQHGVGAGLAPGARSPLSLGVLRAMTPAGQVPAR